jgi:hypothetical protein
VELSDAEAWWRWNHALQQNLRAVPEEVLLMYACSFQHIVDDKITMLTTDPDWDRTYHAIMEEVDRRAIRPRYEQSYRRFKGEAAAAIHDLDTQWGTPNPN